LPSPTWDRKPLQALGRFMHTLDNSPRISAAPRGRSARFRPPPSPRGIARSSDALHPGLSEPRSPCSPGESARIMPWWFAATRSARSTRPYSAHAFALRVDVHFNVLAPIGWKLCIVRCARSERAEAAVQAAPVPGFQREAPMAPFMA